MSHPFFLAAGEALNSVMETVITYNGYSYPGRREADEVFNINKEIKNDNSS